MEGVVAGGNRRIDKVLGEGFLAGLTELPMTAERVLEAVGARDRHGAEAAR